jgi:hypothetical protein
MAGSTFAQFDSIHPPPPHFGGGVGVRSHPRAGVLGRAKFNSLCEIRKIKLYRLVVVHCSPPVQRGDPGFPFSKG